MKEGREEEEGEGRGEGRQRGVEEGRGRELLKSEVQEADNFKSVWRWGISGGRRRGRMVEEDGGRGWWGRMLGEDGGRGWWERLVGEDGGRGWWERVVGEGGGRRWWERKETSGWFGRHKTDFDVEIDARVHDDVYRHTQCMRLPGQVD